jgi:predicted amino acid dehydrogenase
MEQMVSLGPRRVFNAVLKAVRFAQENDARSAALVAYTALVGDRGAKVYEQTGIPITTGNHLTLATMPEAILKAAALLEKNVGKLRMLVLGANPLVYTCVRNLGYALDFTYIYYPAREKLRTYYTVLPFDLKRKVAIISGNPANILPDADIIINATRRLPASFNEKLLKSGAIVFDASYPRSIHIYRNDILLMDGITLLPPGEPKFNFDFGLPERYCFPCMAEPMALAFEGRHESYSLGKDFSADKANDIWRMAHKHGFELGDLTSNERVIPLEKIVEIKRVSKKRRSFPLIFK